MMQKMMHKKKKKNENDEFQLTEKVEHASLFLFMAQISNYETLYFKTVTFPENGTSLNKRLTCSLSI